MRSRAASAEHSARRASVKALSAPIRVVVAVIALLASAAPVLAQIPSSLTATEFAALSARLSEPSGYFDTDNLISNEDSYLHVVGTLKRVGVTGGVYLGVGPDQNFSYIAAIRPRAAFIVDVRRDNLLHHLLLKSAFALARNRLEYMCVLFGRQAPADTTGWGARDIAALLRWVETAPADPRARDRLLERVRRTGVSLSAEDLATIARFHNVFTSQGPALRFNTFGRAPQPYYPDYRQLLSSTDLTGRQSSYLAHESDFQVVKSLQDRNLVIPVVGDFGGEKALAAVGAWIRARGEVVSAFYTSNVEQYLFRDGSFRAFAATVARLPRNSRSVMLRSYFLGGHPDRQDGYHATQLAQFIDRFVAMTAAGSPLSYRDLVTRDVIRP